MTKTQTPPPTLPSTSRLSTLQPSLIPHVIPLPQPTPTSARKPRRPLSPTSMRQRAADREEMASLLAKLQQLVPGLPKKRRLSKLSIIQHVIDYIFDLQLALESHPISGIDLAAAFATTTTSPSSHQDPVVHYPAVQQSPLCPVVTCDYTHQQRIPAARPEHRQPLGPIML